MCTEEEGEGEGGRSVVEKLFGCAVESVSVCQCGWSSSRRSTELLFSLTYPPSEGTGVHMSVLY